MPHRRQHDPRGDPAEVHGKQEPEPGDQVTRQGTVDSQYQQYEEQRRHQDPGSAFYAVTQTRADDKSGDAQEYRKRQHQAPRTGQQVAETHLRCVRTDP